jgi:hypothetical protein
MSQRIHEGTPKELAPYLAENPTTRFRLIELDNEEEQVVTPNNDVLTMLREIAIMKATMKPTDGAETDRLLREARAGAMYSDDSNP